MRGWGGGDTKVNRRGAGKGTHVSWRPFKEEGQGQGGQVLSVQHVGRGPSSPRACSGTAGCVGQVGSKEQAHSQVLGHGLVVNAIHFSGTGGLNAPSNV